MIATVVLNNDKSKMKYVQEYDSIMKRRTYRGNIPFYYLKKKKLTLEDQSKLFFSKKLGDKLRTRISIRTKNDS